MDEREQECPTCDFSWPLAEEELAGEDVVCPECGTFFPFDAEGDTAPLT